MWHSVAVVARRFAAQHTFEDYLSLEETSNTKHAYVDGLILALLHGSPEHSALTASISAHLAQQVRGGRCRVHSSDLRVRVAETGLTTYPDATVICGPWQRDPASSTTVLNPSVIVEVVSPSTEAYDRGEKREHYQRIPSLGAIVLVAPDRRELEVWQRRESGGWDRALFGAGERAPLPDIGGHLDVDTIYDDAAEPTR